MQFTKRFWAGIEDGSITMTFRRWRRRQVVAGNTYRTPAGILEVLALDVVAPSEVTDADAARAGFTDAATLLADLRGSDDLPLYRVRFRRCAGPDPRDELANDDDLSSDDVGEIRRRLGRLDAASSHGAWTHDVLGCIAANPSTRAPDLAARFGRETGPFKRDVRKLKSLGLTISLNPGYRLSPRGEAYLAAEDSESN